VKRVKEQQASVEHLTDGFDIFIVFNTFSISQVKSVAEIPL